MIIESWFYERERKEKRHTMNLLSLCLVVPSTTLGHFQQTDHQQIWALDFGPEL